MKGFLISLSIIIIVYAVLIVLFKSRDDKKAKHQKAVDSGEAPMVEDYNTRHVVGLPVPDGAPCCVQVYKDRVAFVTSGKQFSIPLSRVTGATTYTDTEMRQQIQSSLFQTMLGGAAFGDAGAIIGAMPHSKYKRVISKYNLMVSFKAKDGSDSSIVVTSNVSLKPMAKAIHPECKETIEDRIVEL